MKEEYVLDWYNFKVVVGKLAKMIKQEKYSFLYGVPKNGLIIAQMVSKQTGIPLMMEAPEKNKDVLVIDDLIDSGKTIEPYL